MGNDTVAVAVSGGVDSCVAAALLLEGGLRVTGLHMVVHREPSRGLVRARQACQRLGIPFQAVDLRAEFRRLVVEPFVAAYRAGRTPNPCLGCNAQVKFGLLLARARRLCGASLLATGHYARLGTSAGGPTLLRGADPAKDQSYFLALTPRATLGHLMFPLGGLTKARVRELATGLGLWDGGLPEESQEVCFLAGADYRSLLGSAGRPGEIVDLAGTVLGRHRGIAHYTIGQRRGLGVAGGKALYVRALDGAANRVVVAAEGEAPFSRMLVGGLNWLSGPRGKERLGVRTRYRQAEQGCRAVLGAGGGLEVVFDRPQRALAPGQGAVFYEGERVIAGGIIEAAS